MRPSQLIVPRVLDELSHNSVPIHPRTDSGWAASRGSLQQRQRRPEYHRERSRCNPGGAVFESRIEVVEIAPLVTSIFQLAPGKKAAYPVCLAPVMNERQVGPQAVQSFDVRHLQQNFGLPTDTMHGALANERSGAASRRATKAASTAAWGGACRAIQTNTSAPSFNSIKRCPPHGRRY